MGDMREAFDAYNEMKAERRAGLEPKRFKYAIQQLEENGHTVERINHAELLVNGYIKFWPFTGWFSGKGIGSGRGIKNLIEKLEKL